MNEPRTEAGRRLLRGAWMLGPGQPPMADQIRAIEQEAAALVDVERLRQALYHVYAWPASGSLQRDAEKVAEHYARLSLEDSAVPQARCDRIVNNGMGEPTECGRPLPCEYHSAVPQGAERE